jgi:hypothetical protein
MKKKGKLEALIMMYAYEFKKVSQSALSKSGIIPDCLTVTEEAMIDAYTIDKLQDLSIPLADFASHLADCPICYIYERFKLSALISTKHSSFFDNDLKAMVNDKYFIVHLIKAVEELTLLITQFFNYETLFVTEIEAIYPRKGTKTNYHLKIGE